jgi:hypothetical protein
MPESRNTKQDYDNHIRFYPPYHFVFLPISGLLLGSSIYCAVHFPERRLEWVGIASLFFMMLTLAFMLRQHYSLGNQDRIIRLEMRLRYYQITGQRFETVEDQLSFGQIAALRFAPDDELPALVQKTRAEHLSPGNIKKQIKNWLPDYMRL